MISPGRYVESLDRRYRGRVLAITGDVAKVAWSTGVIALAKVSELLEVR
jgi:hypothetical protein